MNSRKKGKRLKGLTFDNFVDVASEAVDGSKRLVPLTSVVVA